MNFDKKFNKPIFKEKGFVFDTSPRKVYIVFIRALTPLSAAGEGDMKTGFNLFVQNMVVFQETVREKYIMISLSRVALSSAAGGADMKTGSTLFVHTADTVGVHCTVPVCQDLKGKQSFCEVFSFGSSSGRRAKLQQESQNRF